MHRKRNTSVLFLENKYGGSSKKNPQKVKIEPQHYPMILPLGIYLNECMSESNRTMCTPMFSTALFIIAKF
jgi:hypothetical protein